MNLYDAIYTVGVLGFDDPKQAMYAILTHDDWRERWDCSIDLTVDETLAVFLLNTWRNAKLSER